LVVSTKRLDRTHRRRILVLSLLLVVTVIAVRNLSPFPIRRLFLDAVLVLSVLFRVVICFCATAIPLIPLPLRRAGSTATLVYHRRFSVLKG
jgi:hypothetical protein